ncbi:MAG: tRNA 2-thiocytidine(32) synthetase TtcA [Spirochaetales bacterium]|nr:tRNA 2-thiocytidine(32) synthetase TtcA [Spirochaetales bacterium]
MGRAIAAFDQIQNDDRILVAVSGGKDSLCLLHFLSELKRRAPVRFDLIAVNVDQGQPGFPARTLPTLFREWGVQFHIETQDTYSIVLEKTPEGKAYCSLCSRLRRGILTSVARRLDCNKLALGHHREDLVHTFLLNALYSGKLGTMPPIYEVAEGGLSVIRPLCSVPESWLAEYARMAGWPIIPCNLCGSQAGLRRAKVRELLNTLEKNDPEIRNSLFAALGNVHRNELLDRSLWSQNVPRRGPGAEQDLV